MNLRLRCSGLINTEIKNDYDDILVEINGARFNQQDYQYIQQLPEILKDNLILEEDFGSQFEVGNLKITIFGVDTFEKDLIK